MITILGIVFLEKGVLIILTKWCFVDRKRYNIPIQHFTIGLQILNGAYIVADCERSMGLFCIDLDSRLVCVMKVGITGTFDSDLWPRKL